MAPLLAGYEIQVIDGFRVRRKRQRDHAPAVAAQALAANIDEPAVAQDDALDQDQPIAQSPSPEPEAVCQPTFENALHVSATLRQACAEHAAAGTQQHVAALCQHAFKQAAEHVRAESSAVASAFDAMVEQCPAAIANVFASPSSEEATTKDQATEQGIQMLVNAEKARLRAALRNKQEQRQHLLKLQEQVAEQRAALEIVRQQRERSAAMRKLQTSGVWQDGLKQAAPGVHPAQDGHTFTGPAPQPETDLTLLVRLQPGTDVPGCSVSNTSCQYDACCFRSCIASNRGPRATSDAHLTLRLSGAESQESNTTCRKVPL